MKLSVIIPCHPSNRPTLPRLLQSLQTASGGLDVETLVIDDEDSRGLSWARNQGLDRARGDLVFFADADDAVRPAFFTGLTDLITRTGADFALSSFAIAPLKRDYNLTGNAAIRRTMTSAFFGYSFADVERWNAGGDLAAKRELGGVWRGVYRREFLARHRLRFDENLRLYEDAPFIAECSARAEKVASTGEIFYDYAPGENGLIATSHNTARYWSYKFAALQNRLAIAARVGSDVLPYFAASAVFTALELLRARQDWRGYLANDFVAESVRRFPCSWRHALVGAGVRFLRRFA